MLMVCLLQTCLLLSTSFTGSVDQSASLKNLTRKVRSDVDDFADRESRNPSTTSSDKLQLNDWLQENFILSNNDAKLTPVDDLQNLFIEYSMNNQEHTSHAFALAAHRAFSGLDTQRINIKY